MSHDAESLLEVERIDEVLDAADPAQPVVVIQYPTKGRARFWVMASIVLIPIGAGLIYHRMEVERLRQRELAAIRDLESWKERKRLEAARQELVPAERATSPSTSSPPATEASHNPATTSPEGTPHESPIATSTEVAPDPGHSPSVAVGVVRETGSKAPQASLTGDSPAGALTPSPTAPGSTAVATAPAQDPQSPLPAPSPAHGVPVGTSLETGSVRPPADASPTTPVAVAVPAEPPLPSKEEMDRMIQEEAIQKQEAIRRQVEDKAIEIYRLRNEERFRFHQDLRQVLEQNGRQAGEAIDKLCVRYGYESDNRRIMLGMQIWSGTTKSYAYRAAKIRAMLDLPETAILNFISDGLHARLRTPGGPRDSNEVRVRAAQMLLKYCALPSFDDASRPAATARSDAPAVNRRSSTPSSKATGVARPH